MNPNPQYKFIHLGGMTAVYQINDANQTVNYAFTVAHPKDKDNRKIARSVALGRLQKGGTNAKGQPRSFTATLEAATQGSTKYRDITNYIIEQVGRYDMERAAKRGDALASMILEYMAELESVDWQGFPISEPDAAHSVTLH